MTNILPILGRADEGLLEVHEQVFESVAIRLLHDGDAVKGYPQERVGMSGGGEREELEKRGPGLAFGGDDVLKGMSKGLGRGILAENNRRVNELH